MWHMRKAKAAAWTREVQATRSDRIFRLIYRSRNTIPAQDRKAALGKLFSQARSRNKGQHITGALLVSGDWFAQVLEGDEAAVRELHSALPEPQRPVGRRGRYSSASARRRSDQEWRSATVGPGPSLSVEGRMTATP
jgi:hypothetical protein